MLTEDLGLNVNFPVESQVYLPREIAAAAGVPEQDVVAALAGRRGYVGHDEAVAIAVSLRRATRGEPAGPVASHDPFLTFSEGPGGSSSRVPFAVSGTVHAGLISAAILVTSFTIVPAATVPLDGPGDDAPQLVFLNVRGPGGGGGGGGLGQQRPPAGARRSGHQQISSPVPEQAAPLPPETPVAVPPPLVGETLPVTNAPVMVAAADDRSRIGTLEESQQDIDSHGRGAGGGGGTGRGSGLGPGEGSGLGRGSGGGTGGGPFRPGADISPPRVLHEVKATYTEEARRAGLMGEVILEAVVRRDGRVGDVRLLRGLGGGLSQRAIEAVRQWTFSPATRQGAAVDVLVEVAVEFSLR